jgi:tRNA dimethylallyltransferase
VTPQKPQQLIVICGPTAVGKTGFAIELARQFGGEIVGADSMQIYRRMDIGTAKPTARERKCVVHHMVDILNPDEDFDAVRYARLADHCIARLASEQKKPFVVGGTGLYIKALVHGLTDAAPAAACIRERLQNELAVSGAPAMHRRLQACDPASAERIHPNDSYRILRALEVFEITGRSITHHYAAHGFSASRYDALHIGLALPRDALYERINRRVDIMLAEGFVDEVRTLLEEGYGGDLKSMQSLGYRHMVDYLRGRLDWDEAVRTMKRDHRRYAKRQLTWFGATPNMHWLAPDQHQLAAELIEGFEKGGVA